MKKVFLKISQNLRENICAKVSFSNKVAGLGPYLWPATLIRKEISKNTFFKRTSVVAASKGRFSHSPR